MPMKQSINQYRNINGKHYKCWCSDYSKFEELKKECKREGVSFRIIDRQFYKQVIDSENKKYKNFVP